MPSELGRPWEELTAADRAIFVSHLNQYSPVLDTKRPQKVEPLVDREEREAIQQETPNRHRWERL